MMNKMSKSIIHISIFSYQYNKKTKIKFYYIFIIISLLLFLMCGDNKSSLTTKDYYYNLALKHGYTKANFQVSDKLIQEIVKDFRNVYPNLSEKEIYRQIQKEALLATPDKALIPLLNNLLKNMPEKYQLYFSDVFVGLFRLNEMNATCLLTPNGGHLILINDGLLFCFYEWAKLFVNIVIALLQSSELQPDAEIDILIPMLNESIQDYFKTGEIPSFPNFALDKKMGTVVALSESAIQFVIAHELAHIILGNFGNYSNFNPTSESETPSWINEISVDSVALEIFISNLDQTSNIDDSQKPFEIQMRMAGLFYCLYFFDIMEFFKSSINDTLQSYQFLLRTGRMKFHVQQKLGDLNRYGFFIMTQKAIGLLQKSLIPNPRIEDLSEDMIIIKECYLAYKYNKPYNIYKYRSEKLEFLKNWAINLIKIAEGTAGSYQKALAGEWTDGDYLSYSDQFKFALFINDLYKKNTNKDAVKNTFQIGAQIVQKLRESAAYSKLMKQHDEYSVKLKESKIISEIISINPDKAQEHLNNGILLYKSQKLNLSLIEFNKAIEYNPYFLYAYFDRALVFLALGKYSLAIEDFNNVIKIDSCYISAYRERGFTHLLLKKYNSGINDLEIFITLAKQDTTYEDQILQIQEIIKKYKNN